MCPEQRSATESHAGDGSCRSAVNGRFSGPGIQTRSGTPQATRRERAWAGLTLLVVAAIWGSAFVAQRIGNEMVGPFTFNGTRFLLGALVLLPFLGLQRLRGYTRSELRSGALLGVLVFAGASLQQIGLLTTTAGQGGFITGLYLVFVPLFLWAIWRERIGWSQLAGAALGTVGLFLLSVQDVAGRLRFAGGDAWTLAGTLAWTFQVITIGRAAPGKDPLRLAVLEYAVCALLCLVPSAALERRTWGGIVRAGPSILYAGIFSTALAYTGQLVAQPRAAPVHAVLIMSLESVFAALFGRLLLNEQLSRRQMVGCGLMLAGMLLSQVREALRDERSVLK
jgi:drug/metabolite transporter (DMT)-like permease